MQDAGLGGADDPSVLEWAAQEGRILLTHDVTTITRYAYEHVEAGRRMPGVFEISQPFVIIRIVEDILLLVDCSLEAEWEGKILFLPLS